MKILKKLFPILLAAGIAAVSVLFVTRGCIANRSAADWNRNLIFYLPDPGISPAQIDQVCDQMRDQENPAEGFTAWTTLRGETLQAADIGRQIEADVILLKGDSSLLISFGKALSEQDREGCLIGEKASEDLFGSHITEGQIIKYNGRELTVREVLSEPEDVLICQYVPKKEKLSFDHISVRRDYSRSIRWEEEHFLSSLQMDAQILRYDLYRSGEWIHDLMPGKWSDFSGWKENIRKEEQAMRLLRTVPVTPVERIYMDVIRKRNRSWCVGSIGVLSAWILVCWKNGEKSHEKIKHKHKTL